MLAGAATDGRQRFGEAREAAGFACFAHPLPFGMIAILQPPGSIAPDGLDVSHRVGRIEHVVIGRWHGQRGEALCFRGTDRFAARSEIAKTAAMALALYGQCGGVDVGQPELLDEPQRRCGQRRTLACWAAFLPRYMILKRHDATAFATAIARPEDLFPTGLPKRFV